MGGAVHEASEDRSEGLTTGEERDVRTFRYEEVATAYYAAVEDDAHVVGYRVTTDDPTGREVVLGHVMRDPHDRRHWRATNEGVATGKGFDLAGALMQSAARPWVDFRSRRAAADSLARSRTDIG